MELNALGFVTFQLDQLSSLTSKSVPFFFLFSIRTFSHHIYLLVFSPLKFNSHSLPRLSRFLLQRLELNFLSLQLHLLQLDFQNNSLQYVELVAMKIQCCINLLPRTLLQLVINPCDARKNSKRENSNTYAYYTIQKLFYRIQVLPISQKA